MTEPPKPDWENDMVSPPEGLTGPGPGGKLLSPVDRKQLKRVPVPDPANPSNKVEIDVATQGKDAGGVWLDKGELAQLLEMKDVIPAVQAAITQATHHR